jgi:hypothetical protein
MLGRIRSSATAQRLRKLIPASSRVGSTIKLAMIGAALFALPLVMASPCEAQEDGETAELVLIRFDWPEGLTAEVEATRSRFRRAPRDSSSFDVGFSHRLKVAPHQDGFLIETADFRISNQRGGSVISGFDPLPAFQAQLGSVSPDYIVSRDGQFLRLVELDALVKRTRSLFEPMLDSIRVFREEAAAFLESMLSEAFLQSRAAEEWNALVGTWVGAEFELGEQYGYETEEASPLIPNTTIPFYHEFTLIDYSPCFEGAPPRSCVILKMLSYPDAREVRSLLDLILQRMAGKESAGQVLFEELEIENTVRLLTEPETLIPHRIEIQQVMSGTVREAGNPPGAFLQIDRRAYHYNYDR